MHPSSLLSAVNHCGHKHPSLLLSAVNHCEHKHPSLLLSAINHCGHMHPSSLLSAANHCGHKHPSLLLSAVNHCGHKHPSLLLSAVNHCGHKHPPHLLSAVNHWIEISLLSTVCSFCCQSLWTLLPLLLFCLPITVACSSVLDVASLCVSRAAASWQVQASPRRLLPAGDGALREPRVDRTDDGGRRAGDPQHDPRPRGDPRFQHAGRRHVQPGDARRRRISAARGHVGERGRGAEQRTGE